MAVSGTAQEDLMPRGGVQNIQWTSPVPHHQDQTSPTSTLPALSTAYPHHHQNTAPSGTELSKDAVEAMTVDTFVSCTSL